MDLSVVIPAQNVADTIGEQLDALLQQEWSGQWEIVVVDNLSTDRTASIVMDRAKGSERIRLVAAPGKAGWSYTHNVGVAGALADAVCFCDGDDIVSRGWVAAMGDALREHEFVTGALELSRLNPRWLANTRGWSAEQGMSTFFGIFPLARGANFGFHRDAWRRIGGFDESDLRADDMEFSLRMWLHGVPLTFVPDAVVHYRYRQAAADLLRQGLRYGAFRPFIYRKLTEAGAPRPPRFAGWKSWAWLLANGHRLATRRGRAAWVWVAGNRLGQLQGCFRYRTVFL